MKRKIYLLLYYGFARFLPVSVSRMGGTSRKIRYHICKHIFKSCGKDVNIERMADFGNGYEIEIGDRSGIGINCHVPNDIKIGTDVLMGPNVHILVNHTHNYDRVDIPIIEQGGHKVTRRTIIGDDVWIGRQVLMISGKQIGNHTIIGAGSVVSKDVPDYVIAAGNPIRIIKQRK